jgi:hypothetical protein
VRTFVVPATLIDLVSRGTFDRSKPQLSEARLASDTMGELKREADQEIREKAYIIVEELIQLYK